MEELTKIQEEFEPPGMDWDGGFPFLLAPKGNTGQRPQGSKWGRRDPEKWEAP